MYLQIRGVELYYEDTERGIPVLCIHGFPMDSSMWRNQRPLTSIARLITPDLRGQGRSVLAEGPYLMESLADDMADLITHLNLDRTVVMGLSLGGYVALAMYVRHPERFHGLILSNTRAEVDTPEAREGRLRLAMRVHREGTQVALNYLDELFSPATHADHPELVDDLKSRVAQAHPDGLAWMQLGMAQRQDASRILPAIHVPTLVLCGEDDVITPPEKMRAMADRIPGAQFAVIPRAGHLSPLENPDDFNREVLTFLQQLPKK